MTARGHLVCTRSLADHGLRRARLLAARSRSVGSINRRAILNGEWDGGTVVRGFREQADAPVSCDTPKRKTHRHG